jgi:hypothetical protein
MSLEELRIVISVALVGLLVLLRFDTVRFGAAEYDPGADNDTATGLVIRFAWPVIAIGLTAIIAVVVPPGPSAIGVVTPAQGWGPSIGLALIVSAVAIAALLALAWYRERQWPPTFAGLRDIFRAVLDAVGAAIVDEVTFRGVVLGLLLVIGIPVLAAWLVQALLYGLATRLGAMTETLPLLLAVLLLGAINGLLTLYTGSIVAGLIVHVIVRFTALIVEAGLVPLVPRPLD